MDKQIDDKKVVKDLKYFETYKDDMNSAMRRFLVFFILVALASMLVWLLEKFGLQNTALLYIGIPIVLSIITYFLDGYGERSKNIFQKSLDNMLLATIVLFSSAIVLQEGWICVLILLPIYYFVWIIGFLARWITHRKTLNRKLKTFSLSLPVLVLLLSLEGISPHTTFNRSEIVTHSITVSKSVGELKQNLQKPLTFTGERNWFLKLFPLPSNVALGSLNEGDVHRLDFTYWRWFFAHKHEGSLYVKIKNVSEDHIITEITKNTSFYSRYLDIKNTRIDFDTLADGKTKVTLHIAYERKLDPYWYFGPMQNFAMQKAAEVILTDIIIGG